MKPSTLADLWKQANTLHIRVRDVLSLEDFLITGIVTWKGHLPEHMTVQKCDEFFMGQYFLDCSEPKYALLSTPEESEWMKTQSPNRLVRLVKREYEG